MANPFIQSLQAGKVGVSQPTEPTIITSNPFIRSMQGPAPALAPTPVTVTPMRRIAKVVVENIKGINLRKLGQSLIAGAKATPGMLQQGAGVILQNWRSAQSVMDRFFSPIQIKPTEAIQEKLDIRRKVEKVAPKIREAGVVSYLKATREYAEKFEPSKGLQGYLEMAAFNIPQMATSTGMAIAVAVVTKNPYLATTVGLSSAYGLGASEVYSEARESGLGDKQALPLATIGGVIIGGIDFLPMGRLIRKTGAVEPIKKSIVKKVASGIVSVAIQSGFEGVTESAQEIVGGAIASTYNENRDVLVGVKEAAFVGALLGGFGDVTVAGVTGIVGKKASPKKVITNIEKQIDEVLTTPVKERTAEQEQVAKLILSQELTPDEAITFVIDNDLDNTKVGKKIIKVAGQAKSQDLKVIISPTKDEKSLEVKMAEEMPAIEALKPIVEKPVKPIKPVEKKVVVPKPLKPVGEGEKKVSKLAVGVEAKAISEKLVESLGELPEYRRVDMAKQAQMTSELLRKDPNRAIRIALGEEAPPARVLPESVFIAVENKALIDRNVNLVRQLATSSLTTEATAMGQRIRALAERDPDSVVGIMKKIVDARTEALERRQKKSAKDLVKKEAEKIKKEIKTPVKQDWLAFINSIEC